MLRDDIRCPIRIPASEDFPSRRCEYLTGYDGFCPVHRDVTNYLKLYKKTRTLTEAGALPKPSPAKKSPPSLRKVLRDYVISLLLSD